VTRRKYLIAKAAELITGQVPESYTNEHMERGILREPDARALYEFAEDVDVRQVGLGMLDDKSACASPDGLVGEDGGIEIKSVIPTVHIETILAGKMSTAHMPQVQGNMWIFERTWWDFISYCPEVACNPLVVYRVMRDDEYIDNLRNEVARFNEDLSHIASKMQCAT
jgi:hypothetical protein